MLHILTDALRNSILITGLVVIMMMMIESLNIESRGLFFKGLHRTRIGQVVIGALLGSVPGCMGGFATVSLYTHRMFSFGALVAMMIASSGDEAFIMLAMIPRQALILFAVLFVIAVMTGILTDALWDRKHENECPEGYVIHSEDHEHSHGNGHAGHGKVRWHRAIMFIGLALFIAALVTGKLGHDHSTHAHGEEGHVHTEACIHEHHHEAEEPAFRMDLLSEDWMNVLFAGLSIIMLFVLGFASDHFVEGHLWEHIIKRHLPVIFAWTFGVLLLIGTILQNVDVDRWISDNTVLMILLAALIGIIPESGPHMIFVTLFAAGMIPFPVLLASSISQDGHASIPLLAESRKSFLAAKLINVAVAVIAGLAAMLFM